MSVYTVPFAVGANTTFRQEIFPTLWEAINYGAYSVQFFLGNPRGLQRARISQTDLEKSRQVLKRFPLHVFTHFPYITNLAGTVDSLAWDGNSDVDTKLTAVLEQLQYEVNLVGQLDCPNCFHGVVIHPGCHVNRTKGLKAIAASINRIDFAPGAILLLENSAGQGRSLGTTLAELKQIYDQIELSKQHHVRICIDTCHLFAAGQYDLGKRTDIDRFWADITVIFPDQLQLIHLNDSVEDWNSRKDRHACLGTGRIWTGKLDLLLYFLQQCEKRKVPLILETHGMDMITIAALAERFGLSTSQEKNEST